MDTQVIEKIKNVESQENYETVRNITNSYLKSLECISNHNYQQPVAFPGVGKIIDLVKLSLNKDTIKCMMCNTK